ncbi:hypothetical protein JTE90_023584 [Oedothorax gibbosus]|uniref:Uncharacterized protein n=1 Tax=Oedothorax gibbosus TaxID=931172 RepID=A0AAV6TIG1_9ARAC|nr:hypothetical protein JTE90_023584 [Oedothorax gibbosus]
MEWVICAPAAYLDVVAVSHGSLSWKSNPDCPCHVTTNGRRAITFTIDSDKGRHLKVTFAGRGPCDQPKLYRVHQFNGPQGPLILVLIKRRSFQRSVLLLKSKLSH